MAIFQISLPVFYIIALFIYGIMFLGTPLSFLLFRKNINGMKTMFLGFILIVLGIAFLNTPDFKVNFPVLNFLSMLLGVIICYIGVCKKN